MQHTNMQLVSLLGRTPPTCGRHSMLNTCNPWRPVWRPAGWRLPPANRWDGRRGCACIRPPVHPPDLPGAVSASREGAHLLGARAPHHVHDLAHGGAPHDGVVDQQHVLALEHRRHRVELPPHAHLAQPAHHGVPGSASLLVFWPKFPECHPLPVLGDSSHGVDIRPQKRTMVRCHGSYCCGVCTASIPDIRARPAVLKAVHAPESHTDSAPQERGGSAFLRSIGVSTVPQCVSFAGYHYGITAVLLPS
jgi:hypothetical protein